MYKPSNRRSPRMVRRPKGDAAAAYAAHALRRLNGISRHFAGYDVADANATADIQAMCQFNDLRNITLQAYIRDTALAEWVVRVYDDHYTLQEPVPTPSEFVLRSARFQVVVSRMGREKLYAHLLKAAWSDSRTHSDHQYTGTVLTLPQAGRPGVIISENHRNVLLSRDARHLKVGERVRFSLAWDSAKNQKVAHSIVKAA